VCDNCCLRHLKMFCATTALHCIFRNKKPWKIRGKNYSNTHLIKRIYHRVICFCYVKQKTRKSGIIYWFTIGIKKCIELNREYRKTKIKIFFGKICVITDYRNCRCNTFLGICDINTTNYWNSVKRQQLLETRTEYL
jgi:hypothetical protein